jgi:hypothetical protein
MRYAIEILKSQALRHSKKIQELKNLDHEKYIEQINTAIEVLIEKEKKL